MGSRILDIHRRGLLIQSQIDAAIHTLKEAGLDHSGLLSDDSPYLKLLNDLYSDDFQLATIWEKSDLVVHAEGPAAKRMPHAKIVSWLIEKVDTQMRYMIYQSLNIAKPLQQYYQLDMTGIAHGSIYAGFAISDFPQTVLCMDDEVLEERAKVIIRTISWLPEYIGKEEVSANISEAIPDPIARDSALVTALNLSPTGRNGIHTLEFSDPHSDRLRVQQRGELNSVSRAVLRDTVEKNPILSDERTKYGSFVGEFREADLDKQRLELRNIDADDVNILRCFFDKMTASHASNLLGKRVKVTGNYETLPNGKPRFMKVSEAQVLEDLQRPLF